MGYSDLIFADEVTYHPVAQHRLKPDQYEFLSKEIVKEFPTEVKSTYYVPYVPIRNSPLGKGIYTRGRFVDKVRNILYISGDSIRCKKAKIANERDEGSSYVVNETIEDALTHLKHYTEPWNDISEEWKLTVSYRRHNKDKTLTEFLKTWPILKDTRAEQLIELDFQSLYKKSNLLSKW